MANENYRFTIQAQDNASKTIKGVSEAFNETGKTAKSNLDEISKKFDKIQNSTVPVRKKLVELQKIMAQMNYEGLDTSPMFTKMAMTAGSYKDALSDAAAQVRVLSTDHLYLDTAVAGLNAIFGAAQTAAGAYTLLGGSEEDARKMTAKLVAIQSVYNGVQTLANSLNKDSNLIQGIKAIQTRLATVAVNSQTASTIKATIAQKAFNFVAKENPYVLLASAAVALGTALLGISIYSDKAKEKEAELQAQEEANRKTFDRNQKILNSYYSEYGKTLSDMLIKYRSLQAEWRKLTSTSEKNKWISENKRLFDELGISVNNVADAERNLLKETKSVIESFKLQAQAKALEKQIQMIYETAFDPARIQEIKNDAMVAAAKSAKETAKNQPHNELAFSKALEKELAKVPGTQEIMDKQMAIAQQQSAPLLQQLQEIYEKIPTYVSSSTSKGGTTDEKLTPEQVANKGIKAAEEAYKQRIQQLADMLAKGISTKKEIENETLKAENDYITSVVKHASTIGGVDKLTKEQQKRLSDHIVVMTSLNKSIKDRDEKEKADKNALEEHTRLQNQLNAALKQTPKSNIAASDKYKGMSTTSSKYSTKFNDVAKEYDRISDLISEGIAKGLDISLAQSQLSVLGQELDNLASKAKLKIKAEGVENVLAGLGNVTNYMNSLVTVGDQWNRISEQANGLSEVFQKLALVIQLVSGAFETFNTVMTIVSVITSLIHAKTAATAIAEEASASATKDKAIASGAAAGTTMALVAAAKEEESAMLGAAAAAIYAAHAYIPFGGVGIASGYVATMMAEMAAMKAAAKGLQAFANGGIVSGGSLHGDKTLIRVNEGEMVLNTIQQKRLFDLLNSNSNHYNSQPNNVVFKLHGKELVGLINNYSTSKNKII